MALEAPGSSGSLGLLVLASVGLLGGAHCLGMCGPLVSLYSRHVGEDRVTWYAIRQHALFNAGRTVSYAAVGALLGALGGVAYDSAAVLRVGDQVRIFGGLAVGMVVLAFGVGYIVRGSMHGIPTVGTDVVGRTIAALDDRIATWARRPRIVAMGSLHAVLPCPLLYPAYLYALASGSAVTGGLSLGVLGLGTFPSLFAYGLAFGSLGVETRVRLHRALGVAFVVMALIPLTHALALAGFDVPMIRPPTFGVW